MVRDILASAGGAVEDKLYVEDVFSTYLYTGNGSTQTINNGIDLAGKGGLVWIKNRKNATWNTLFDTARGVNKYLTSNGTDASATYSQFNQTFTSNGFTLNTNESMVNASAGGDYYASWTFRKAPKFYTQALKVHTTGTPSTIDLSTLGVVGMVTVKSTVGISNWFAWHKDLTAGNNLKLNLEDAQSATNAYLSVSGTTLTISGSAPSDTYIVYAWAHAPSAGGIIQCGSFTTNVSGNATVTLGWEPQYLMFKRVDGGSGWHINDIMRGAGLSGTTSILYTNYADSEAISDYGSYPTETGFKTYGNIGTSGNFIYLAIRRPMKVPTSGTEVYNSSDAANGASFPDYISGFAVDLGIQRNSKTITGDLFLSSRLIQGTYLQPYSTAASSNWADMRFDSNNGWSNTSSAATTLNHSWMFKRAKGFMDIVCYTGTGVARTVAHNLGVVPELMIVKVRNYGFGWQVYSKDIPITQVLQLELDYAPVTKLAWNSTTPTASVFSLGTSADVNANTAAYVAYLFATLAGISKVGSYTGNGTTQTIPCGFSTGARFVLCKAVSTTGNWNIGDSTRGITSGTDPLLCLNTTSAEVTTDDWLDPESSGFIVNETASAHANTNGVQYIFLAVS